MSLAKFARIIRNSDMTVTYYYRAFMTKGSPVGRSVHSSRLLVLPRSSSGKQPGKQRDAHHQAKGGCDDAWEISTVLCTQHQMGDAVPYTSDEREKKNNEVGQRYSPVDTQSRQHESGEPQHIERHKARIAPIVSEQPWELMLKASYIFLGEMQALHGDGEQIDGKDGGGIVLPASCYPNTISHGQTATEKNDGGAHPVGLCSQHDQDEDGANYAVARGHRVCPTTTG